MCTRWCTSALHSRMKTFDMAFRHLFLSESWRKVRHHLQTTILKMHLPSYERAFPVMTSSVTNLQCPLTGAIQACSRRGH